LNDVRIVAVATANPPLRVSQEETYQAYVNWLPLSDRAKNLLHRIFVINNSIGYRHFGMDSLADMLLDSQDALIARYQKFAVRAAVEAAQGALRRAHIGPDGAGPAGDEDGVPVSPQEIDAIVVNSCTGYLCPGLTSYVAEALELRSDIHPFDLQGMGCGAALPNLESAYNYLQAHPNSTALAIAVEICSATLYFDEAPDILISNALFGDGAAAALLTNRPGQGGVRLRGFSAGLYPQDREHLYFRTENSKLRNVLSVKVPAVGARNGGEVINRLLAEQGLAHDDIDHWIVHPGGQKVLDTFQEALALPPDALDASRKVLYNYGNMSSASVLFVLEEVLRNGATHSGGTGVMCSFGAGFGAYAGLLEFL
jgi:predicted naringenin-chalcone synthase